MQGFKALGLQVWFLVLLDPLRRVKLKLPSTSRTISYGGRNGTPGNSGVINVNPPLLPSNDEFMIYLNQVNDQAMLFPDLGKEYVPLDVMAKKIAGYSKSVSQDRSASTIAEMIAYAYLRALNAGNNLVNVADLTAKADCRMWRRLRLPLRRVNIRLRRALRLPRPRAERKFITPPTGLRLRWQATNIPRIFPLLLRRQSTRLRSRPAWFLRMSCRLHTRSTQANKLSKGFGLYRAPFQK